jgi:hypothetical protein
VCWYEVFVCYKSYIFKQVQLLDSNIHSAMLAEHFNQSGQIRIILQLHMLYDVACGAHVYWEAI